MDLSEVSTRPKDYFSLSFFFLRIMGLGWFDSPSKKLHTNFPTLLYKIYCITLYLSLWVAFILFEIIASFQSDTFSEMIMNLSFTGCHLSTLCKSFIFLGRNERIRHMAYMLEVEMSKYKQDYDIIKEAIRRSRILSLLYTTCVTTCILFGSTQVALASEDQNSRLNCTEEVTNSFSKNLPYQVYIPWRISSATTYNLAYAYQVAGIAIGGYIMVGMDSLTASFIIHMAAQFQILQKSIENVTMTALQRLDKQIQRNTSNLTEKEKNSNVYGTEDENILKQNVLEHFTEEQISEEIKICFGECIKHHQYIISCADELERIYTLGFLSQVVTNFLTICMGFCQIAENEIGSSLFIMSSGFVGGLIAQLGMQCFSGNELTIQGLQVSNSVANINWIGCDGMETKKGAISMRLLMQRAQRPICITAGKFMPLSISTFIAIMKGGYSYFTFVNRTKE